MEADLIRKGDRYGQELAYQPKPRCRAIEMHTYGLSLNLFYFQKRPLKAIRKSARPRKSRCRTLGQSDPCPISNINASRPGAY